MARVNPRGSTLLASAAPPGFNAQTIAIGPDGDVYLAGGSAGRAPFQPSSNAFQTVPPLIPPGGPSISIGAPSALVKMYSQLQNILAATYFANAWGSPFSQSRWTRRATLT